MTSLPHNATNDTAPQNSQPVHRGLLLLLGILCALFLAATYVLQHTRFVTAAAGDALQVTPTFDSSATKFDEADLNLAILKIAH
jgi:hypothetical protein